MKHRPVHAVVVAGLAAVAVAGCGGGGGATDSHRQGGQRTASAPAQVLPSAPDPLSIHVPTGTPATGGPATGASAEPLPTGPTLELSPLDPWRRTSAVMAGQKSASLTIDFRDGQGRPVHTESSVAVNGDCVGRVSAGGGRAQVIHADGIPYLKGDLAFWTWAGEQNGTAGLAGFRAKGWLKGSPAQLGAYDIEAMCALPVAVGNVTSDFNGLKQERGPLTVAGRQVVSLTQTGDTATITLYVAASGPAVVVKAVQKGETTVTTAFTDLGEPVHATPPAHVLGDD